jgi:hypothetical protein
MASQMSGEDQLMMGYSISQRPEIIEWLMRLPATDPGMRKSAA